jgi:cytoskeletal protein CcmA (bactofilin family)
MWKKDDIPAAPAAPQPTVTPARTERASSGELATIGRSITIRGEVSGDEDLLIQGKVEGSVDLRQHALTIGPEGEVKASIVGRVVTVQGRVEGNVTAEEQVILRSSASVDGDITAPRVVLEDGARFRGGVDMGDAAERGRRSSTGTASARKEVLSSTALEAQSMKPIEARATASA